jgi:protein-tyrosine phosphatase
MAEAIFGALAAETGVRYEVGSAGTAALVNEPIAPYARAALEEVGVFVGGYRARQVDKAMVEEADLVLAMTPKHAGILRRLSGPSSVRVQTLLGYVSGVLDTEGIPDPYGRSMTAHRASVRQLYQCPNVLVERLGREW